MSIPVVEIEHKYKCDDVKTEDLCDAYPKCVDCPYDGCAADCPACAVEANNKAWAKYLDGLVRERLTFSLNPISQCIAVRIPISDWEQIKKLAEEKVDG